MTSIELARLVLLMRARQKEYFRTRTPDALREAKAVEAKVDRLCRELAEDRGAMLPLGGDR